MSHTLPGSGDHPYGTRNRARELTRKYIWRYREWDKTGENNFFIQSLANKLRENIEVIGIVSLDVM